MSGQTQELSEDPFDEILNLEERYYKEGHALGVADGSKAGRVEGRLFGMQKGFEKFSSMGGLGGQCAIWEARMMSRSSQGGEKGNVPAIKMNERLQKNVATLAAMTEAASLDTHNTEDAISEFEDRLKRAEAKAKIISSIVGESPSSHATDGKSMEDFSLSKAVSK